MTQPDIKQIDYFSLDGPLSLPLTVGLGLVIFAIYAWSIYRESRILGRNNALLFMGLRTVALAAALWMLLAPLNVKVTTSTTKRTVAFLTDVSGSMQTVDPSGSSDEIRWSAIESTNKKVFPTALVDQSAASFAIVQQQLLAATTALRQHSPETRVIESISAANIALQRSREHLEQFVSLALDANASTRPLAIANRLLKCIEGAEFLEFSQLCVALQKGRIPAQKGWRESLPDLEHRIAGIRRTFQELARMAEAEDRERMMRDEPARLNGIQSSTRSERVRNLGLNLEQSTFKSVREKAEIQRGIFDQSVTATKLETVPNSSNETARRGSTNISAVMEYVQQTARDQALAAVFVVSDLAHNDTSSKNPREIASTLKGTPIYVVPIGNAEHVRDAVLQSVSAPEVAMRNDEIVIEATIQAHDCEGEVLQVQLIQDGEKIDQREVVIDSGFATRAVRFEQAMPTIGPQRMQVKVLPIDGELTEENNQSSFEVNVTRRDIKILVADEMPRWEYRYLTQLFRRDPKVQCDEMLFHPRLIATGSREATKTLPVTIDDWDQYDVVILGDLPPEHFPVVAQQSLCEYLKQRGGTLVMIAGQDAMPQAYSKLPLSEIVPVTSIERSSDSTGSFAFRVTPEGQRHHALTIGETDEATRSAWEFVNQFSPLYALSAWRKPLPSAHSLIAAVPKNSSDEEAAMSNSSFLCWQGVGRGRVVYLSGPDTYRLRFLRGDRLHFRFWGQLLRWAIAADLSAGSKFVRMRTDKTRYQTDESVYVTVQLIDSEGAPVIANELVVRLSRGDDQRVAPLVPVAGIPGEYKAEIRSLPPGTYRVEPIGAEVSKLQEGSEAGELAAISLTVQEDVPREMADTRCDRGLAQQIADVTGGQVIPPTAIDEILHLTKLDPIVVEKSDTKPLWLEWKYLWIVFGCLQTEWIVRKWKGLS